MDGYIEIFKAFLSEHRSYEYLIIFFSSLFGGEFSLFTLGFLAGQGVLSMSAVAIFGFLGAISPNLLWFFIGRTNLFYKVFFNKYTNSASSTVVDSIGKMSKGKSVIAIIIIKFMVGTPILLATYASKSTLSIRKFIFYQALAILLSMMVIIPLGFLSGLGFTYIISIFDNFYAALGFILLMLMVILSIKSLIKKQLTQNTE